MYHVYPINDIEEHDLHSSQCKCNPSVEIVNGEMIIIHNSFDGREALEMANKLLTNNAKDLS